MPTHSATVTGKFQSMVSTCGTRPTARPCMRRTLPDTGETVPSIALRSVDLPEPDGPTMPMRSPASTVRSTSISTGRAAVVVDGEPIDDDQATGDGVVGS